MRSWKEKLSSRKLWCAIVGFLTSLSVLLGWSSATAERVAAIVMAGGSLVAFILAEGWVDAAGMKGGEVVIESEVKDVGEDVGKDEVGAA